MTLVTNPLAELSDSLATLVEAAAPALVSLQSGRACLSGFFWRPDLVVTAEEALPEEGEIQATLADGSQHIAAVLGRDPTTDVALLRIAGAKGAPIDLRDTSSRTGALALGIGAGPTAQLGVIAHAGPAWRSMRGGEIDARIELDVALRRESEGGLAIDSEAQVLGMIVQGPRRRTLVIPSKTIAQVAELLDRHGRIPRGYLGVVLQPVRANDDHEAAVIAMQVDGAGPASAAGVRQGDVIIAWNGTPPARLAALLRDLGPASIGQPLNLTIRRGDDTLEVVLTVAERAER